MEKKKAALCSSLLAIIMFAIFVATYLIKSPLGFNAYDIISPCIVGAWSGIQIKAFYNWLIK